MAADSAIVPLRILLVSDGRPGHEKQSRGLVQALGKLTPVAVAEQAIEKGLVNDIKSWLAAAWARLLPRLAAGGEPRYDLVVGAGAHTHGYIVAEGAAAGARTVVCMAPTPIFAGLFDLCLVPEADCCTERDNFFTTVGPPNLGEDQERHDQGQGLILVGGIDEKSHRWDSAEIVAVVKEIANSQPEIRWAIATSPRTPDATTALLAELCAGQANCRFNPFPTPEGWLDEEYNRADQAWVTADSISMVYEALTAGCRVGIIPVVWKNKKSKFARSAESLLARRYVMAFAYDKEETEPLRKAFLDEAGRCAQEILVRFWPQRLPAKERQGRR
ncbi:MAG: ELM1/GtrOC1 family putative glycosyltransferase [Thermodesulfobacteriota bacterium]